MNDPAYPKPDTTYPNGQVQFGQPGLTKRELVAAMVLQGLASNSSTRGATPELLADTSVLIAEALLTRLSASAPEERK